MTTPRMTHQLVLALAAFAATSLTAADQKSLGYTNTPMIPGTPWHVHDGGRPQPRVITSGKTFSDLADAPSDAVVLFDGKDFSKWRSGNGGEVKWKLENGYMETTPKSGVIRTKDEFSDFQLHLEFATPEKVVGDGQGRGNNGVNIFGRYEIQVLDSYNNKTYPDGQAAAIYGQTPPLVNASRPPGVWQTYDIVFEAPRWDAEGKLSKKGSFTVFHNGVLMHHRQEIIGPMAHRTVRQFEKHEAEEPFGLQDHDTRTRFRNIWIRRLKGYDQP